MFRVDDDGTLIHLSNGKYCGLIIKDVDGYYYWWPGVNVSGTWDASSLLAIGALLNDMNADWNEIIREELS